jgi:hypothetical protein
MLKYNRSKGNTIKKQLEDKKMTYRIELIHKKWGYKVPAPSATVEGIIELKDFLKNCIDDDFKVSKITKTFNDGRGEDITKKYI